MNRIIFLSRTLRFRLSSCNKSLSDELADRLDNLADAVREIGEDTRRRSAPTDRNIAAMTLERRGAIIAYDAAAVG